jgi:hypothetical protein
MLLNVKNRVKPNSYGADQVTAAKVVAAVRL